MTIDFIFRKVSDEEGSSEPFYARLWIGILALRDDALRTKFKSSDTEIYRKEFDNVYMPVLDAMGAMRTANKNIQYAIHAHKDKVLTGEIVQIQEHAIGISESIDKLLRDSTATFLINGVIAIKGIQKVAEIFNIDIGCLFTKEYNFKKGVSELEKQWHKLLAQFLQEVRSHWSERLILRRDSIEHEGWVLPPVEYRVETSNKIEVIEPHVDGIPLFHYSIYMLNQVMNFVENILMYSFKTIYEPPILITEIPLNQRDPVCPKRFHKDLRIPGKIEPKYLEWNIKYSEEEFGSQ